MENLSDKTFNVWLHKAGCEYRAYAKSYYTDNHETTENMAARKAYACDRIQARSLKQPVWMHIPEQCIGVLKAKHHGALDSRADREDEEGAEEPPGLARFRFGVG